MQIEKLENGNVRVIAESTTEANEVGQEDLKEIKKPNRNPPIHVRERENLDAVQAIVDSTETEVVIVLDKVKGGLRFCQGGAVAIGG